MCVSTFKKNNKYYPNIYAILYVHINWIYISCIKASNYIRLASKKDIPTIYSKMMNLYRKCKLKFSVLGGWELQLKRLICFFRLKIQLILLFYIKCTHAQDSCPFCEYIRKTAPQIFQSFLEWKIRKITFMMQYDVNSESFFHDTQIIPTKTI